MSSFLNWPSPGSTRMRCTGTRIGAGFLVGSLLLAACSELPSTTPEASPTAALNTLIGNSTEHAALDELTRAVAVALREPEVRQRLLNHLRASRHTIEHKLELRPYLEGPEGRHLVDQIARNPAATRKNLLELVKAIRPLELYLPIDEHRETWIGGDLLVAGQIGQSEPAFIYHTSGQRAGIVVQDVPSSPLPVLALVPVETDFSRPLDATKYDNTRNLQGTSIGTWKLRESSTDVIALNDCDICVDCPPECTGDPPPPPPPPSWTWADLPTGVYITHLYIPDDHEGCCLKGDPEFEVHLHAPNLDPKVAEDLRCAGEHAPDTRSRFDMNTANWAISASRRPILIADSLQQARFVAAYGENVGMGIVAWEDDDTACKVKADPNRLKNAGLAAAAAAPNAWAVRQERTTQNVLKALPGVVNAVLAIASWLKSDDDIVGVSYQPSGTCTISGNVGWRLTDDSNNNKGCIVLKAHVRGSS